MFQIPYHTLRPLTTAHLAQTMSLLSLTATELRQSIDAELAKNPALELVEERRCPTCHRLIPGSSACPVCSRPKQVAGQAANEPIVIISPREIFSGGGSAEPQEEPEDRYAAGVEELPVYVFRQIAPDLTAEDRPIAAHLLTNLDENGLLAISLEEAARYLHVLPSRIQAVQRMIQRADPMGVGSSTVEDALLVQLDILSEVHIEHPLARRAVLEGMSLLSRHQYSELARLFKVSMSDIQELARFIGENLNPYPVRLAWGERHQTAPSTARVYYQPDILISYVGERTDGPLMVEIILPMYGTLRVNPLYRQAIQEAGGEQKEGLREDLDKASLFVKCIQQRNHTIQRLMQRVVSLQREFILHGEKHMKPVTRASIAQELDVHESTISRAVSSKAVQLPNGRIVPLSCFFDRSLNVRTILREIIKEEPHPLNDSELASLLAERGFSVARRTVAKYRAMEGILPANLRQSAV